MFSKEILLCLEQKEILLTEILNLTKQIEVRCSEPEITLDHLLEQRAPLIVRAEKCDRLIQSLVRELPESEQSAVKSILGRSCDGNGLDEDQQKALRLAEHCKVLFRRAAALHQFATENLKKRRDEVQEKLKQLRKPANPQEMFYSL